MKKTKRIQILTMAIVMIFLLGINTVSFATTKMDSNLLEKSLPFGIKYLVQSLVGTGTLVDSQATWKYLDDNTDPATDGNRTSWTEKSFDDSGWKTGHGSFGAKNGNSTNLGNGFIADVLLNQYISGSTNNVPTYFFRTSFHIDHLDNFKELVGELQYDDAAIVYINGKEVAQFDAKNGGYSTNLEYGGSGASDPKTDSFKVATGSAILYEGQNELAVEVHQASATSSDVFFNLKSLVLNTNDSAEIITQKAISLSMGANETERNITWYASDSNPGKLQVALKSDMVANVFPEDRATTYTANVQSTNDAGFYSNQLTMHNLKADSEYVYRLQNGATTSQMNSFKTGSKAEFSFLLAGDPQIGASGNVTTDTNGWDSTLSKGLQKFTDTDFIVSAGDQVNTASNEIQYAGYLEHSVLKSMPIATVIGNHDSGSAAYSQHFNNSNAGAYGATTAGSDYWYVYNNTLFLHINTNNMSTAEHKEFMEKAIASNPNVNWKVVVLHHSIYSVANHATQNDILQRRDALAPVFKALDIDVVLMGHDHVYVRSYMMNGLTPEVKTKSDSSPLDSVTDPDGILYITVNSASGSKFYAIQNQSFPYVAVKSQENVPNISNVEVTKTSFKITTYRTSDMSVVDMFEIKHTDNTTENPSIPTPSPSIPIPNPSAPTSSPSIPIPNPSAPTSSPSEPTKSPVEPTKSPSEPTKSPVPPTKSPTVPTKKPSTPSVSVKVGSKGATLSWKKVKNANGYKIYVATKKNGNYKKIKTVNSKKTVSYTISNLKKGKTYYVKVRAYHNVGGKVVNSGYSKVVSFKVK